MNEEELKHRIRSAFVILQDSNSFKVGDLTFSAKDKNSFSITGWTIKNELKNITKRSALNELNEIKLLFTKMVQVSSELSDFIDQRQIEFNLGYDYGLGGIGICSEIDGQIKWKTEIKE
ncbi:hypothetical protein [Roseivirga sp.]|uniref:hypothetical protein n=1 Tax=Roseivirga sp. TaxID=1964215 RepID=UPI003B8BB773